MSTRHLRICLTTTMLRILQKHGPHMHDSKVAELLRETTGPDFWNATRVMGYRSRFGIPKSPEYMEALNAGRVDGAPMKNRARLGEVRLMQTRYGKIKHIALGGGMWRRLYLHVWEEANGKLPKGLTVRCIDGDMNNCELSNLTTVPLGDIMRQANVRRKLREAKRRQDMRRATAAYLSHKPYEFAT